MGMGMASFDYLAAKRLISGHSRILDIGSQNLYNATPQTIRKFVELFGSVGATAAFDAEIDRIAYFSTPRAGERTAYISELLDLTTIGYESYDVCPALKTEIYDLNVERLPNERRNSFDLILNFGTTEHLINQLNAFEVMHDAMKVGGVAFHQLPSVGWIDHGYFNYNRLFVDDLAKANGYEVFDKFFTPAGVSDFQAMPDVDIRDNINPLTPNSASGPSQIPNFNLNYLVRKMHDAPFYVGLEIATTHSPLSEEATKTYGEQRRLAAGDAIRDQSTQVFAVHHAAAVDDLRRRLQEYIRHVSDLENSTSWKITRPLRAAKRWLSRNETSRR